MEKAIILFDGVCNLCNRSVQFIIKRDKENKFMFASLQGKKGQELLNRFGLPVDDLNSFVLVEDDKVYTKSSGALRVLRKLGGGYKLLYGLIVVPKFIRDPVYNWVAKNRYKWYGKREECMIPRPELRAKFIE